MLYLNFNLIYNVLLQLDRAKDLLQQDPSFKKGFKFDHIWSILKDMKKFTETMKDKTPT